MHRSTLSQKVQEKFKRKEESKKMKTSPQKLNKRVVNH